MDERAPPRERIQLIFAAKVIAKAHRGDHRAIGGAGLDDLLVVAMFKSRFVFAADLRRAVSVTADFIAFGCPKLVW